MTENPTDAPRRKIGRRDGLFRRNDWWWIDYQDAEGKRHRRKAAPDYQTARMIYRNTVAAIARGEVLGVREEGIKLKNFVEEKYWPAVKPMLSFWEQQRARGILDAQIITRFGGTKLVGVTREDVEQWQAQRLASVSASTANKELMRFKHLLNRAVSWSYLKNNPARSVKKAKEAPGRTRYLTPAERQTLIAAAAPGLRPYIIAALQTGARRGELLSLRWLDVDFKARVVTFAHTKNGDTRAVPMTDTFRELLLSLPRPLDREALVLPQWTAAHLTVAFGRLVRSLKLYDVRFHDLRHDVASTLTMAGVPQRTVMAILGHRDPRMTLRYQHLSPQHLRDAARALDQRPMPGVPETAHKP